MTTTQHSNTEPRNMKLRVQTLLKAKYPTFWVGDTFAIVPKEDIGGVLAILCGDGIPASVALTRRGLRYTVTFA